MSELLALFDAKCRAWSGASPVDEDAREYAECTVEEAWQDGSISFFEMETIEKLLYDAFLAGKNSGDS